MIRLSLQLQNIKKFHGDVILTSAVRSYICYIRTVADFSSHKYTFDCKYVSFCIELNTFVRLGFANSFFFLILPCCYFYVMSQPIFPDQIRPRPLIACLNCAALRQVFKRFRQYGLKFKPRNGEFFRQKVEFIGRSITSTGVEMGDQYIGTVRD